MSTNSWKLNDQDLSRLNDSLERCVNQPGFLDRFYELFLGTSDDIKGMFRGTDFRRLKRMLRQSLYVMLLASSGNEEAWKELEARAVRHNRQNLNVRPELYEIWLHCLIMAVSEYDHSFDSHVERIWRTVMRQGMEYMIDRY